MVNGVAEDNIAVWIGCFTDEDAFVDFVKVRYDLIDDFEDIRSTFEKYFQLDYYDRDLVEMKFLSSTTNTLQQLFSGASYLDEFVEGLDDTKKLKINAIILVFDYLYEGLLKQYCFDSNSMEFYGNISYKKIIDTRW